MRKNSKEDQEAIKKIAAWRERLLSLFDVECQESLQPLNAILSEITSFSEQTFQSLVPKEHTRFLMIPKNIGYSPSSENTEAAKCGMKLVVALDTILDEWASKIAKMGLPKENVNIKPEEE